MFRWYVINTYSGHENKVKQNLEHRVVSLGQQRAVRQVVVPTETVQELKDNQKVSVGTTTWRTARVWPSDETRCSRFCLTLFSCPE